jgi:hypothetical protein
MAKQIVYGDQARQAVLRSISPVGQRGQGHPWSEGSQRRPRQEVRIADDYQGRRDGRALERSDCDVNVPLKQSL